MLPLATACKRSSAPKRAAEKLLEEDAYEAACSDAHRPADVDEVRKAIDAAKHPALFMVDTISSLASVDYRHDEWGVDVTVAGSQTGLMLPPGLSFNCVSEKARAAGVPGDDGVSTGSEACSRRRPALSSAPPSSSRTRAASRRAWPS